MKKLLLKALVLVSLWPVASLAVRVPGLYEAEVPVASQTPADRAGAMREAMRQVLIKLTGDRRAGERENLMQLLAGADAYVQQFRYLQGRTVAEGLRLSVRFDEANLNAALRNSGTRLWGRERPSILVWIALDDGEVRRILTPDEDPLYFSEIDRHARERGVVLVFPLHDLEDTAAMRPTDIWAGFHEQVLRASSRYLPDLVLVARLDNPIEGIWAGQFTIYIDGEPRILSAEASWPESLLAEGMNAVTDLIAGRYLQDTVGDAGQLRITVTGVDDLARYAAALHYLQTLSAVTRVDVTRVMPGTVEFAITAHGGIEAVTQAISFGRLLEPDQQAAGSYRMTR